MRDEIGVDGKFCRTFVASVFTVLNKMDLLPFLQTGIQSSELSP